MTKAGRSASRTPSAQALCCPPKLRRSSELGKSRTEARFTYRVGMASFVRKPRSIREQESSPCAFSLCTFLFLAGALSLRSTMASKKDDQKSATNGHDNGGIKVRVIEFELHGRNATVSEGIKAITEAISVRTVVVS